MRKIILSILVSSLLVFLSGCDKKTSATETTDSLQKIVLTEHTDKKRIHNAVMNACNLNDWVATEFKSSVIIAEKMDAGKSASVTISFNNSDITIIKDSSTLGSAYNRYVNTLKKSIQKELQSVSAH